MKMIKIGMESDAMKKCNTRKKDFKVDFYKGCIIFPKLERIHLKLESLKI